MDESYGTIVHVLHAGIVAQCISAHLEDSRNKDDKNTDTSIEMPCWRTLLLA